jgi:hypothetical protein
VAFLLTNCRSAENIQFSRRFVVMQKGLNRQKQTNGLFGVKTVIFTKKQVISHKNLRNMHQNAM